MTESRATITIPDIGMVSAIEVIPPNSRAMLVFAHGAGAGMTHAFMESIAKRLADRDIATLRFNFPYMEAGSRRPDSPKKLTATIRAAIDHASAIAPDLAMFAGGKSMGGRMTSTALSEQPDDRVRGIIFFGFPLHPAGKDGTSRAEHLGHVQCPMLFLQGTRDKLANLKLLTPIVDDLSPAQMHIIDGADHGFHVRKRSGRTDDQVLDEIADVAAKWIDQRR